MLPVAEGIVVPAGSNIQLLIVCVLGVVVSLLPCMGTWTLSLLLIVLVPIAAGR